MTATSHRSGPRLSTGPWVAVAVVVGAALALRLFYITHQSLWHDEGFALLLSDGTVWENLEFVLGREAGDRYQPAYYVALGLWRDVFGSSEIALRLPSAFMGAATAGVVFGTARRLFGEARAWWSAALVVVSGFAIYFSQETRPYAFIILLSAVQLWLVARIFLDQDGRSDRWALAAVTGAGFFVSIFIGIIAAALFAASFVAYPAARKQRWRWAWWPAVLAAVPGALLHVFSSAFGSPESTIVTRGVQSLAQNVLYVPYGIFAGLSYGPPQEELQGVATDRIEVMQEYWLPVLGLAVLVLGLVVAVVMALRRERAGPDPQIRHVWFLVITLVVGFVLAFLFAAYTGINWVPRHSAYLAPPVWVLAAFVVGRSLSGEVRKPWATAAGTWLTIGLLGVNVLSVANYFFNDEYERGDYRSTARLLEEPLARGEPALLVTGTTRLFDYYGVPGVTDATMTDPERLERDVATLAPGAEAVWIVQNRPSWWAEWHEGKPEPAEIMERTHVLTERHTFTYMEVYRYVPADDG
jgi:uncharacterized membrane protein